MERSIYVNFPVVYQTITELRNALDQDVIAACESRTAQVQQALSQVDGATNAELISSLNLNKEKTLICANTLRKLLGFLEQAARAIENEDAHLATQLGEK